MNGADAPLETSELVSLCGINPFIQEDAQEFMLKLIDMVNYIV